MALTTIPVELVTLDDGVTITVDDNSDNLTLTSTDADANAGPNLRMYRNSSSPADSDALGLIEFEGRNDNTQDVVYAGIDSRIVDASDGTEDGRIEIVTMLAGTAGISRILMDATETVFNDNSKDLDFRVESDAQSLAFFVDGGENAVGLQTNTEADGTALTSPLTISGANHGGNTLEMHRTGNSIHRQYMNTAGTSTIDIYGSSSPNLQFSIAGSAVARVNASGICFGSDTAAANALDDYEEGTWSPAISSGTATFSNARYTKIGRLVHFSYQVQALDDISSNNHILVTGLPFPVAVSQTAGVAFGTHTNNGSANVVYVTTSEDIYFYGMSSASWDTMLHSELNSTSNYFYVSGNYQAE